jgi:hypothetical protein
MRHRLGSVAAPLAAVLLAPLLGAGTTGAAAAADAPRQIAYAKWGSGPQLRTGTANGLVVSRGELRIGTPAGRQRRYGVSYDFGRWTSPWTSPGFALTELVPSWDARTPRGTWLQVQVRGVTEGGTRGGWDNLGRWAEGDAAFRRTSLGAQTDDVGRVATDTWLANHGAIRSWQLRLTLYRRAGTTVSPRVDAVGAMVSALPQTDDVTTSRPGVARGLELAVPRYSQMTHVDEYPQYGGGGEAWCSPTSTAMVLGYYGRLPSARQYAWVSSADRDRFVDHVARMTYDYGYRGTGNWPFNTAYAATRVDSAFVTRFASLRGVERFIRAGIPVVTSVTFGSGRLTGAPISATNGHLLVVVGFTDSGDVVANDPAAPRNATVRRVYDRGQFEDAWLQRYPTSSGGLRGSGGLAYVIHDAAHPLPARNGNANW